ncbi:MAG: hypothetical protein ACP5J3_13165, partial [Pyrobaculum sp.]
AGAATESIIALHHGLYSEAVVSAVAGALALVEEGRFEKAVEYVRKAAEAAYEALREWLERAKVALERLYELFVEAVARVVAWVDEHRAWLFLAAAASAGVVTWAFAHDVLGSVQLGKLALAAGLIKFSEFKKPPTAQELVEAVRKRSEAVGKALEELFKVVDGLSRGAADVDERRLLKLVNMLEAAGRVGEPWLVSVARTLKYWDTSGRNDEERSGHAKAAFLIVWAALQRRAAEVYDMLVEMWEVRKEVAAVLRQALDTNSREKWREYYDVLKRLEEAERSVLRIAEGVERELNTIAVHLKKTLKEVAKWIEVDALEARRLAGATHDELSRYSGASYGTRAVAYLRATVDDNAVGLTALRALVARDLAALVAYTPGHAYKKLLKKAPGVKRGRLSELPLEERLAVALGRVLKDARGRPELKLLVEAFERGDVRVEKTEKEGEYVIYAGGKTAVLELIRTGGAQLSGDLVKPLAARKEDEVRRAVERYEEMWKKGVAPLPSRAAVGGWLLSDISVKKTKKVRRVEMETASLEQAVTFLSAFGVRAGEIHWGRGKRREKKPVKIYIDYFDVTGEGLKPVYCVELYDRYAKEVLDRLRSAPAMYEEERKAIVDFITRRLDRKVLERLGTSLEEFRQRLERWLGEWPYRAPKITRWDKDSRVFHTLLDIFRELARGECDAEVHEEARRHAVETLLHAVLGDGSVKTNEVVLYVGKGKEMSAGDKAALYYALLRELGYQPKMAKAESAVHIRLSGEEAGKFAREALPFLVGLERLLEVVKSDEQIYSKVEKLTKMARAERVKAWIKDFTTEGKRPRARLIIEADG